MTCLAIGIEITVEGVRKLNISIYRKSKLKVHR